MERVNYPVRKSRLEDQESDADVTNLTPAERLAMVWTLTMQAWMFKEGTTDEPRLRRDVVRVVRRPR